MQDFTTPMMKQYKEIKKQHQDCLLFYRMGDFYELFLEDAQIGASVLDITLTSRAKGRDGRIPMAGVPYHAVDPYIAKLVRAGYKVAICEQMSEPSSKGIVDREVVRIITPGTVMDEKALDKKENNYLISLLIEDQIIAISACDLSTGQVEILEQSTPDSDQWIMDEIARLKPSECILPHKLYNDPHLLRVLRSEKQLNIYLFPDWDSFANSAEQTLKTHFGVHTLESFGLKDYSLALQTSAALIGYLKYTQKDQLSHIKKITAISHTNSMVLDRSTMINLELFSTIRERETSGSLLSVIDHTETAMGGRMLKQWLKNPLLKKEQILQRHDAVEILSSHKALRQNLADRLKEITDIERTLSRVSVGIGNARDLVSLRLSLERGLDIFSKTFLLQTPLLSSLKKSTQKEIQIAIKTILERIADDPPFSIKEGGFIRTGFDSGLDNLRDVVGVGKDWIMTLEQQERERTGISSLRVRFNKVFGFYIEVTKANLHLVPDDYRRKQTMVGGERFTTSELKVQEEKILSSIEESNILELRLFEETVQLVLEHTQAIQDLAHHIAVIDCLLGFATLALKHHYVRPRLLYSGELRVKQGRHPVVEQVLTKGAFVPNDVILNRIHQQLLIITGPNMAGKSVFIRQVALIVLLNQIGSFVPAKSAHLSLVDRIFVRSGASDVITSGLSTFMVEMVETAYILHHATNKSLIVMDEIGRGTSTYDGISIAWAVAQYLVTNTGSKANTLFATHYHELQALEEAYPQKIKNYHMAVDNQHETPVFLHTLFAGSASHSFGVAVAKLAGVPKPVIETARAMLEDLEQRRALPSSPVTKLPPSKVEKTDPIHETIQHLDISRLTPLEALNTLAKLQKDLKQP